MTSKMMCKWGSRRNPATATVGAGASPATAQPAALSLPRPACAEWARHGLAIGALLLAVLLSLSRIPAAVAGDVSVLVLDFELNDLTLAPGSPQEQERVASLRPLLAETLAAKGGYRIADIDSQRQTQADRSFGYLFDHHDAAAELGRSAGADWVVVGRVHKASFLFVYFMAHLIDTKTDQLAGDFIVEVKGPQERLTIKGVESLAEKIDETLRGQAAVSQPGKLPD
jgi:hypothetical protein